MNSVAPVSPSSSAVSDPSVPVKLLSLGDTAWTVEFGDRIDPLLHGRVLGLAGALGKVRDTEAFAGIVDVVPTFRSLTVHYDPSISDGVRLGDALIHLLQSSGSVSALGRQWLIPVCFDDEYAPDLNDLAQAKEMSCEAVIDLMTEAVFQVYMIGFMPGFPYMGGLPPVLEMPRLSSPRKAVPARSLAIAGSMCAVYPWESPGGWRLLGRTPIPLFDAAYTNEPALLASGDRVRWQAINRATFLDMEAAVKAGSFVRDSLIVQQGGE